MIRFEPIRAERMRPTRERALRGVGEVMADYGPEAMIAPAEETYFQILTPEQLVAYELQEQQTTQALPVSQEPIEASFVEEETTPLDLDPAYVPEIPAPAAPSASSAPAQNVVINFPGTWQGSPSSSAPSTSAPSAAPSSSSDAFPWVIGGVVVLSLGALAVAVVRRKKRRAA